GAVVVTLQQLDPIFVDFSLPQQVLDKLKPGQAVSVSIDTFPGNSFSGKILAINPEVDPNSRNAQIRAKIANPEHKLLPGMYATLDIDAGERERHITLPQTAITYNPYGSTVFLVQKNGNATTARQAFVTTGATRGDQVAVLSGVNDGDVVVTAGQIKLRNGSPIAINNKVQPADNPAPPPTDH
ncbi:MAG: efflux RND transporter periplasmic adaptor subunit, partial [Alphaproteobacteria bacterium]|nr:efflux RND transporter periplasmic adaptor subunit [Alphaproteobacteria bacterium]